MRSARRSTPNNGASIFALAVAMALTVFQSVAYYQNGSIALVWINAHVDLDFFGFVIPTPWFNAIDPFISIVFVPVLITLWRWQDDHGGEPNEIVKIGIGAWMAAGANFLLVVGCLTMARVPAIVPGALRCAAGRRAFSITGRRCWRWSRARRRPA